MITESDTILALNRMLRGAEESAEAAELELAAAAAELLQLREVVEGQQKLIDANRHALILSHEAYQAVVAERDALVGRLVGGIWVRETEGSAN